ncbi:MAG: hypothetical protein WCR74_11785 [Betaproteobacteria bacterium]
MNKLETVANRAFPAIDAMKINTSLSLLHRHSGAAQRNPESMGFAVLKPTPWIPAYAGMTAIDPCLGASAVIPGAKYNPKSMGF